MEEKKLCEINEEELGEVTGGFLGFLGGYSTTPTPAAQQRGLVAGSEFENSQACLTCGSKRYRVKDFHENDSKMRVACCGCGAVGYWDYSIYDVRKM